ncbi:MAG TPA: acetate--CoA ligase family protein [Candidatus Binataceae bacterium]|nr:acetate--CoA ligase family protein [Candidatus Binataceae bacterium]
MLPRLLYASNVNTTNANKIIAEAAAAGRTALSEIESKKILEAIGIPSALAEPAASADDAVLIAARIGFPVVLKVLSPEVTHKSEVGGVELNLRSTTEVRDGFDRIRESLAKKQPGAKFEGVAVQPMARAGLELIAGIVRDEKFGPLIVVGLGGIFVEMLKDTALRLAPIDAKEARAMLESLRGAAMLRGVRGSAAVDIDALASAIAKLSEFAAATPEIKEMDLNPIVAYSNGVTALDARILIGPKPAPIMADPRRPERFENLKRAFEPKVAVVIGDKKMGGYMWLRALKNFNGKLYSVQIDPNEIPNIEAMGIENRKSLAEIKEHIDYAVSAVPRQVAPIILKDCVDNKVGSIGFFTSGFSETTEELGIQLERKLKDTALASDIALVGPNCMGLYSPQYGLCNYPDEHVGEAGDVCFISQSGTHTINFSVQAVPHGIKVNKAASIGNVLMLEAADYIDLMSSDPKTRVLGMYIEGMRDGRRFFEAVRRAAKKMPVLIWKGGVTEAGARATFSHTGSLATPSTVWQAAVRQSGAATVDNLDAMLDAVELVARGRELKGRRMGLVAMTGGQSVGITDTFASAQLEVPTLSDSSYDELKTFFNIIGGSYRNPLDAGGTIGGGINQGNLDKILSILDRDPVIDAIVLEVGTGFRAQRWATHEDELTKMLDRIAEFARSTPKTFAVILHPAHLEAIVARAKELARERGLVVFDTFERAAAAFRAAADSHERRARLT